MDATWFKDHSVVGTKGVRPLIHTAEPYSSDRVKAHVSGLTSATAPHEAKVVETCYLVLHHTWGVPQLCGVVLIVPCHYRDNGPIRYVSESHHLLEKQHPGWGWGGSQTVLPRNTLTIPDVKSVKCWAEQFHVNLCSWLKKRKNIRSYYRTKCNSSSVKAKKHNGTSV